MKNRERYEINRDILTICNTTGGIMMTHMMYKANLAYEQGVNYVKELLLASMITRSTIDGRHYYHITPEGIEYLSDLDAMHEMLPMTMSPLLADYSRR